MTEPSFVSHDSSLDSLAAAVSDEFRERYHREPQFIVAAPGRVNLIGEHIDYNDGFVMPMAIERYVVIAADSAERRESPKQVEPAQVEPASAQLFSTTVGESQLIDLAQKLVPGRKGWVGYVEGVIAGFQQHLMETSPKTALSAFDAVIGSSVPLGGGLSSSAALEVATATLLECLSGVALTDRDKALLCQQAEHRFAGVPCGIMDQFSSVFGMPSELMLIDCRSQEVQAVPMDDDEVAILITNSNVKHELTGGEYAERRSQCDAALSKLGAASWRDVTMEQVQAIAARLTGGEYRRAKHVVSEIARTIEASNAFRNSDWPTAGTLMYASHRSLRDDFDVSCIELDLLVEIAEAFGTCNGVLGSRMTGGGFGGCTVSLVQADQVDAIAQYFQQQYKKRTGIEATCFSSRPARGAHVVKSSKGG